MATPFEGWRLDFGNAAGRRVDHAFIDLGDRARPAPGPLFAVAVPVIVIVDCQNFPVQALRNSDPVGIDGHNLETCIPALFDTRLELRLDAHIVRFGAIRHPHAFGHGAAAGLQHADHGVETQWQSGIRAGCSGRKADHRLAGAVRGRIIELEDLLLEGLVMAAIGEAVESLEG